VIEIIIYKLNLGDIGEEIELCNRYSLLHDQPPDWYLGFFY